MKRKIFSIIMVMAVAFAMLMPQLGFADTATKETAKGATVQSKTTTGNSAVIQATPSKNYASISKNPVAGKKLTFKALGDGQSSFGFSAAEGTTVYVATQVSVSYYEFKSADEEDAYDDSADINIRTTATYTPQYSGVHEATFKYDCYQYTEGHWVYVNQVEKSMSFNVLGTIKYSANGGKAKKKYKYLAEGAKLGTLPKATKKGYKLLGWYTSKSSRYKLKSSTRMHFKCQKSKTIYAKWTKKVTVKFNGCKGKSSKKYKKVWLNKKYGALPNVKRKNYLFDGWYTKKQGGTRITKDSYVNKGKTITLYAHWTGPKGYGYTITDKEYKRIKIGMTSKQVEFLVGGAGEFQEEVFDDHEEDGEYKVIGLLYYYDGAKGSESRVIYYSNAGIVLKKW